MKLSANRFQDTFEKCLSLMTDKIFRHIDTNCDDKYFSLFYYYPFVLIDIQSFNLFNCVWSLNFSSLRCVYV